MAEQGYAPNTRKNYMMGVGNFYLRNYYPLTFFRGDNPGGETVQEGARAASKEDINKMLEVSNPRVRAIILFIKDTGLAEADVAKLKLKDLRVLEKNDIRPVRDVSEILALQAPVPIIVKRQKTKRLVKTFMGKESYDVLKTVLRVRSPEAQGNRQRV